ncbi:MAG TPA: HAD family hydrolase [bacterium]|nr:HAD family hydrolase [bacterium]HPJ72122.1 HAD family hydrolase [bacterium]HPQ65182.1 HAD family hydrolase [bacterium]
MAVRAVFLDRDGVVNEVVRRNGVPVSPVDFRELRIRPGIRECIRELKNNGWMVLIVTNQPDIARGGLDPDELEKMHGYIRASLEVDDIIVCPHDTADGCRCRKPRPGMLEDGAARYGIDLSGSFMAGDQQKDMAAGRAAGCRTILVDAPYNRGVQSDFTVADPGNISRVVLGKDRRA